MTTEQVVVNHIQIYVKVMRLLHCPLTTQQHHKIVKGTYWMMINISCYTMLTFMNDWYLSGNFIIGSEKRQYISDWFSNIMVIILY